MNHFTGIGRLVRDPENRYTPAGTAVANFTIAIDRRVAKDAPKQTDFVDVVVWNKLAEVVGQHLTKGRLVAVEGRLQIRSYEANDGTRRRVAEIVAENVQFLDYAKDGNTAPQKFSPDSLGGYDFGDEPTPF